MQKNKEIHIAYIGRLEVEKGIDILIECIDQSITEERNIIWHICGTGSFLKKIEAYNRPYIMVYGHLHRDELDTIVKKVDLVLMPSLFLETFWLVALETLLRGVPVCWFARGWLQDFIHPALCLDVDNPVDSFFRIIEAAHFPLLDVSDFCYGVWIWHLKNLTEWYQKILLVSDYIERIGGTEEYIYSLKEALQLLWKEVEFWWCSKKMNRWWRIFYMIMCPFAYWRGRELSSKIQEFSPDLIWMHSVMRYIGPHGLRVLSGTDCKKYIMHHDLWLITLRPSHIYSEWDIPASPNLGDWIPNKLNVVLILWVVWKWLMITWIWFFLRQGSIIHLVPSIWMQPHFQKYIRIPPLVFPHTSKIDTPVKL